VAFRIPYKDKRKKITLIIPMFIKMNEFQSNKNAARKFNTHAEKTSNMEKK